MNPTDEQNLITSAVGISDENLLVNALAGTGKTTTLGLIQAASKRQPVLCLAFNKRAAVEMEEKFPSTTVVKTFNGQGHRIWMNSVGNVKLDTKKTIDIVRALIGELSAEDRREVSKEYWTIVTGIGMAKSLGYIPEGKFPNARRLLTEEEFHNALEEKPSALAGDLINDALLASIQASYKGLIDFDDQIYMPALFGGTFPRFPLVLIDEAQDLNPVNHAMLDKLCRNRVVAVGDPWQSIYGFRGALQGGMRELQQKFGMTEFDLSISFRCPSEVVKAARWRVPHFKWNHEGGRVERLRILNSSEITDDATILCRNNAPLFRMALHLLATKRSVSVAGSDIGPKILRIMQKLGDDDLSQQGVMDAIQDWVAEKVQGAQSPQAAATVLDTANCMRVFAEFGSNLGLAIAYAKHLFAQQGTIKLMTGHKAKGGEWDVVYHLDPWLINEDNDQDLNLKYVIQTRSKNELYEIESNSINWEN